MSSTKRKISAKIFVSLMLCTCLFVLGLCLINQSKVDISSLSVQTETTQAYSEEPIFVEENSQEIENKGWGSYSITVNVRSYDYNGALLSDTAGGHCYIQANDWTVIFGGWQDINPSGGSGSRSGWWASEDYIEFRASGLTTNPGFSLKKFQVNSSISQFKSECSVSLDPIANMDFIAESVAPIKKSKWNYTYSYTESYGYDYYSHLETKKLHFTYNYTKSQNFSYVTSFYAAGNVTITLEFRQDAPPKSTITYRGDSSQTKVSQQYDVGTQVSLPHDIIQGSTTTQIISTNSLVFTKPGHYLKNWQFNSGDGSLSFDGLTYTTNKINSVLTAVWEPLTYKLSYKNSSGQVISVGGASYQTVKYNGRFVLPYNVATEGYTGYWTINGSKYEPGNSNTFSFTRDVDAIWNEKPKSYKITWNAGEGYWASDKSKTKTTDVVFNSNIQFYQTEPIRAGYNLDKGTNGTGWYTQPTGGVELSRTQKYSTPSNTTYYAHWVKKSVSCVITVGQFVKSFDISTLTAEGSPWGTPKYAQSSYSTSSEVNAGTQFVVSNLTFDSENYGLKGFTFTKASGGTAEEGFDYVFRETGETYTITALSSIRVHISACIYVTVKAASNYNSENEYQLNTKGGKVALNNGVAGDTAKVALQESTSVVFSVRDVASNVDFIGFYYDLEGKSRFSPTNNATYSTTVTRGMVVYALFKFTFVDVAVYTFSDEKNFLELENQSAFVSSQPEAVCDNIGGIASVGISSGKNVRTRLIAGESISVSAIANTKYAYCGCYDTLQNLVSDTSNKNSTLKNVVGNFKTNSVSDMSATFSFTVPKSEFEFNVLIKFSMKYTFSVEKGKGVYTVSIVKPGESTTSTSQRYFYGEKIGQISFTYDTVHYEILPNMDVWTITKGSLSNNEVLKIQQISSAYNLVMIEDTTLVAAVTEKYFTLKVVALYGDLDVFSESTAGGVGNIVLKNSDNAENVVFGMNNGVMNATTQISAKIKYNTAPVNLEAQINQDANFGVKYIFKGWYRTFVSSTGEVPESSLYSTNANVSIRAMSEAGDGTYFTIRNDFEGAVYYAVFTAVYTYNISFDFRVDSIIFDVGHAEYPTLNEEGNVYVGQATYKDKINFTITLKQGNFAGIEQLQTKPVDIIRTSVGLNYEFSMPTYFVSLNILTSNDKWFFLNAETCFVDNMQGIYVDDDDYEDCGYVQSDLTTSSGARIEMMVEEDTSANLTAVVTNGYTFIGWYKFNTQSSYTNIIKAGKPSYLTDISMWIDEDAYTLFSTNPNITTDAVEDIDNNLYVALFVKNYTFSVESATSGVSYFTTNLSDKNLENINIDAPYGSDVTLQTFLREYKKFDKYSVVSGKDSLVSYGSDKILAEDLFADDDYEISFKLYNNVFITASTINEQKDVSVEIYTYNIDGEAEQSSIGGNFAGINQQDETVAVDIGSNLISYVNSNPGFIFSHFEIGDEVVDNLTLMPANEISLKVYFARNSYKLSATLISEISGVAEPINNGGTISCNPDILFGSNTTMTITANTGYRLVGIYSSFNVVGDENNVLIVKGEDDSGNSMAEVLESVTEVFGPCFQYTYVTPNLLSVPNDPNAGINLVIVFEKVVYDVSIELLAHEIATDKIIPTDDIQLLDIIPSTAHYGQTFNINLVGKKYFENCVIKITNTETDEVMYSKTIDSIEIAHSYSYEMPSFPIKIQIIGDYRKVNVNFNANGGQFTQSLLSVIEGYVFNNYDNFTYVVSNNETKDFPHATKLGMYLAGYNTQSDGNGKNYISYGEYGEVLSKADFVLDDVIDYQNITLELYAIYDYIDFNVTMYCNNQNLEYNGEFQDALTVEISNYFEGMPYTYTWFDAYGNKITDQTSKTLQLKNSCLNEVYKCVVSLEGFDEIQKECSGVVNIKTKSLVINIGNSTQYVQFPFILDLKEEDMKGLLPLHQIDSCQISFDSVGEYDANKIVPSMFSIVISNKDSGETVEEDVEIKFNYDISIIGKLDLRDADGVVAVSVGFYEPTINEELPSISVGLDEEAVSVEISKISAQSNFIIEGHTMHSVRTEYLSQENVDNGEELTVNFALIENYSLYEIYLNGNLLDLSLYSYTTNSISLPISDFDVQNGQIDIRIYITNKCLVTAYCDREHFDVIADYVYIQVNAEEFIAPDTSGVVKEGYFLEGWFYDAAFSEKISNIWAKTGKQNIYAKWVLNLEGHVFAEYQNTEDGNLNTQIVCIETFSPDSPYKLDVPARNFSPNFYTVLLTYWDLDATGLTTVISWFKFSNGNWISVSNLLVSHIENVMESGTYSFEFAVSDGVTSQKIPVGTVEIIISITPLKISFPEEDIDLLTKIYDGNTNILNNIEISAASGTLKFYGEYQSKNVAYDQAGEVTNVQIVNISLLDNGFELASNYVWSEVKIYGKILPYNQTFTYDDCKTYNGTIYSQHFSEFTNIGETFSCTIATTSADAWLYTSDSDGHMLSITDIKVDGSEENSKNYNFDLSNFKVEILKAKYNFVFVGQTVTYDGQGHMLEATLGGVELTDDITVKYIYDNNIIPSSFEGFKDVGEYQIAVDITTDVNHENWNETATLIIKKCVVELEFMRVENTAGMVVSPLQDKYFYDGANMLWGSDKGFAVRTKNLSKDNFELPWQITQDDNKVHVVREIGNYRLQAITDSLSNYEIAGMSYFDFEIVKSSLFGLGLEQTYNQEDLIYNGKDRIIDVITYLKQQNPGFANAVKFTATNVSMLNSDNNLFHACENVAMKDVGEYVVKVSCKAEQTDVYENAEEYVEVYVKIKQFKLSALNDFVFEKVYDGNVDVSCTRTISISDGIFESVTIFAQFASVNAGTDVALENFVVKNTNNIFVAEDTYKTGNIIPKGLVIALSTKVGQTDDLQNLNKPQFAISVSYKDNCNFSITQTQNQQYVGMIVDGSFVNGLVGEDKLVIDVICQTSGSVGFFPASKMPNSGSAYVDWNNAKIYNGSSLIDCMNYSISDVYGGINLVDVQYVSVEQVTSGVIDSTKFDNMYNGLAKTIFVKFNGDLYYATINDATFKNASTNVENVNYKIQRKNGDWTNVGSYEYRIYTENTDINFFFEGNSWEQSIDSVTYNIIPYVLDSEIMGINIPYKAKSYNCEKIVDGINNEKLSLSITIDKYIVTGSNNQIISEKSLEDLEIGEYENKYQNVIYTVGGIENNNYVVNAKVLFNIVKTSVNLSTILFSDYIYNGQNRAYNVISQINLKNNAGQPITTNEYLVQFFKNGKEVSQVKDAGDYTVYICSDVYDFGDTSILGTFKIKPKEIEVIYDNDNVSFVYDAQAHKPIISAPKSNSGVIAGDTIIPIVKYFVNIDGDKGEDEFESVKNAGSYFGCVVSLSNSNYIPVEKLVPIVIEQAEIKWDESVKTEVWFEKLYGEENVQLIKTFTTQFGDIVEISFERVVGETIGNYNLLNPTFTGTYEAEKNYIINSENLGIFVISSYKNTAGALQIEMKNNFLIEYNAETISYFILSAVKNTNNDEVNYNLQAFDVDNNEVQISGKNGESINISSVFNINSENDNPFILNSAKLLVYGGAKNAQKYNFIFESAESITHDVNQITFAQNSYSFVIEQKELTLSYDTGLSISKTYDATPNIIEISGVTIASGVIDNDDVVIGGEFESPNAGNNIKVKLIIRGLDGKNYKINENITFENTTLYGTILQAELCVVSQDNEIAKTYDGTTDLSVENLTLSGVMSTDVVTFSAKFVNSNAGENVKINFELSNDNYIIVKEYTGIIYKKILTLSKTTLNKEFDGMATCDLTNIMLMGVLECDKGLVEIESAEYVNRYTLNPDPSIGEKMVVITLRSVDSSNVANNYVVENIKAEITNKIITFKFIFGDETSKVHELCVLSADGFQPFVNDSQVIAHNITSGESITASYGNKITYLPLPQRAGYEFLGWFYDENFDGVLSLSRIKLTTNTLLNQNIISPDKIEELHSTMTLYALWQQKSIKVSVKIYTENIIDSNFQESTLGGNYTINGVAYADVFYVEYNSELNIQPKENQHYNFKYMTIDGIECFDQAKTIVAENNVNINIFFVREVYNLEIELGILQKVQNVQFTSDVWKLANNKITAQQKYQTVVYLPNLTCYGYQLINFIDKQDNSFEINQNIIVDQNLYLTAIYEEKLITLSYDFDGGQDGDNNTSISSVELGFGSTFENLLPLLSKVGYVQGKYHLYNGLQDLRVIAINGEGNIFDKTNDEKMELLFDISNLIIVATWNRIENVIDVSEKLDEMSYVKDGVEFEHELFSNIITIYYTTNEFVSYSPLSSDAFAYTGEIIKLKYTVNEPNAFAFKEWQVNGHTISSTQTKISGFTKDFDCVVLPDGALCISGQVWGSIAPKINAVYVPLEHDFTLAEYETEFGNVSVLSGVYNDNTKILSGAIIKYSYSSNIGYHISSNNVSGGEIISQDNVSTISSIRGDVYVSVQFERDDFYCQININGEGVGLSYIGYALSSESYTSITNDMYTQYSTTFSLNSLIYLKIKINVTSNYVINSVGSAGATITNKNDGTYEVSGYIDSFVIDINIVLQKYNVSLEQKFLNEDDNTISDILNTVAIKTFTGDKLSEGQVANYSIEYLTKVILSTQNLMFEIPFDDARYEYVGTKYKFIGWYIISDNVENRIFVTSALDFEYQVTQDITFYALYKFEDYSIQINCDSEHGQILSYSNQVTKTIYTVQYGKYVLNDPLEKIMIAKPYAGYTFVGWSISYNFIDEQEAYTKENVIDLTSESLGKIYCNIVCTAEFEKKEIAISLKAEFIDGEINPQATQVEYDGIKDTEIEVSDAYARTKYTFKATANAGYEFVQWIIKDSVGNEVSNLSYNASNSGVSYVTNIAGDLLSVTNSITLEFYGEYGGTTITSYTVIAQFTVQTIYVNFELALTNISGIAGVMYNENKENVDTKYSYETIVKDTSKVYVKLHKGYVIDTIVKQGVYTDNVQIILNDLSEQLTTDEKNTFASYYEVIVTGYQATVNVTIYVTSKTTYIHFAKLIDFTNNIYEKDAFIGTIKYATTIINVDNVSDLIPTFTDCYFAGWGFEQNATELVIDKNGRLLVNTWYLDDDDVDLYPLFKLEKIKVHIDINPITALVDSIGYMYEMVTTATSTFDFIYENGSYYYEVGATFGLKLPTTKQGYSFKSYTYYYVDETNTVKEVILDIDENPNLNFSSKSLFDVSALSKFRYSTAKNTYSMPFEDKTIYILVNYVLEVSATATNYYSSGTNGVVGGTVEFPYLNQNNLAGYNQYITVRAVADAGYEIRQWIVNGEVYEGTSSSELVYLILEPTVFKVLFIGKEVEVFYGESNYGVADVLTGANVKIVDDHYICHVGDVIYMSAESNIGYTFLDAWSHSNGSIIYESRYIVTSTDYTRQPIVLTPIFDEKDVTVSFIIYSGMGSIKNTSKVISTKIISGKQDYYFVEKYYNNISVNIVDGQRYQFSKAMFIAGDKTLVSAVDITHFVNNNILMLNNELFEDQTKVYVYLYFDKIYWEDLIEEKNLITEGSGTLYLTTDFNGSGRKEDPYRIETLEDLVKLSYIVKMGEEIVQRDGNKNAYNSKITYYTILNNIDLGARFWTPIGTEEYPFNSNMTIYYIPRHIEIDIEKSDIDPTVADEYNGLFGYLGADALITIEMNTFFTIYIILGSIVALILLIIIIIVIFNKIRKEKVESFDERNKYLFD